MGACFICSNPERLILAISASTSGNQPSRRTGMDTSISRGTTSEYLDGSAQARASTQGEPEQVGLTKVKVVDDSDNVVAERLIAEGSIDVPVVPVTLQLDGDHAAVGSQLADESFGHGGEPKSAVDHDQGRAGAAMAFPVDVHAIDRRIPGTEGIGHPLVLSVRVVPPASTVCPGAFG
jgi:hypothetical protein